MDVRTQKRLRLACKRRVKVESEPGCITQMYPMLRRRGFIDNGERGPFRSFVQQSVCLLVPLYHKWCVHESGQRLDLVSIKGMYASYFIIR